MSSPLWRIKRLRRPSSGEISGHIAGNHPKTIAEQQEGKDRDRQRNAQRQRLYGPVIRTMISNEKEQPGKQAPDHGKQHEDDDELEH